MNTAENVTDEASRINNQLATQLESFSAQLDANLERGKNRWREWQADFRDSSEKLCQQANAYLRNNPWQALGGAVALGFLVGFLGLRRGD